MGDVTNQAWVTYALTQKDVGRALALCFSLKKNFTSRKLVVIASRTLAPELRNALHHGFDLLLYQESEWNTAELQSEDFVKLFALTLKSFEKLVFLSPTMLAIKNCDDIFDSYNDSSTSSSKFVWTEGNGMHMFVVRPSQQAFQAVMEGLRRVRNESTVEKYLRLWTKNQGHEKEPLLSDKYYHVLKPESGTLTGTKVLASMINLVDILSIDSVNNDANLDTDNFGLLAKLILEEWKLIYNDSVEPLLKVCGKRHNVILPALLDQPFHPPSSSYLKEPIAIVGMSCRYPSANNLEEFWTLLLNGEDGTGNPPEFRWLHDHSKEGRKVNAGFLKYPVEEFDAKFFGISPKEMLCLDPQHRLLHELVWEGLEDATLNPQGLRGTNGGVFIGSWTNDYKDVLTDSGNMDYYRKYMGNSIGAAAARISFLLGMTGPSIATESGCSSAMVAVHLACRSLQMRETNMALACGVNLLLKPYGTDIMPMALSEEGRCKTFDEKADGFGRAEGCGVLVLKRLSDAVRDGDKVWAMIRGSGMSQEGVSKSMGTPTVHCESLAMKQALKDAGVHPSQVSYVEAHGTGTVVGDPLEVAAIADAYHSKQRKEPLLIGSVKTNVGHTESCSGITGIMKVVLAMKNEIIPPHRNFETLNPAIDLEAVPAKIPLVPVKWLKQKGIPRLAGVSSFGITGTDAHAIIEEAPAIPLSALNSSSYERPLHILKISAKTDEALDILVDSYKNHLTNSNDELKDLAYTANIGRADFSQRAVIIAKSKEDAIRSIEQHKFMRGEETPETIGKICFLFTGQGSQYPGMAKELYGTSPVFRMHFEYCEKILNETHNIDIKKVLWCKENSNEVSRTIYSQTSIFCVEYALLKLWESWGIKPNYALGHSLGEFAAAVCAGILSVEDGIKLVAERSRLIDELPRGKMLVIRADKQRVDTLMKKFASNDSNRALDYAAINSNEQTVVAGDTEAVLEFSESCKSAGLKCIVLEATHAFHSKHMDPMLGAYGKVAKTVKKLRGNDCKYISGMTGTLLDPDQVDAEFWVKHTREKVLFRDASKKAVELGCKTFIEIGPQPVLAALTMMNNDVQLQCLPSLKKNENEWETLMNTLGKLYVKGLEIDWKGVDQFYERNKVRLPHYPFIGKKYWPDLLAVTGSTIHPLVGSVISNASSTKLFQSGLNLRTLEYVKDHAIGNNVIFPGAGYLEMCLAAGLATVEGSTDILATPTRPMKIENLTIQAPLCLDELKTCHVQTVVELNMSSSEKEGDWNDMKVNIFKRVESESTKWLTHASATFSPLPTGEEKSVSFDTLAFTQTIIGNSPSDNDFVQEIYSKLATVGLKFGPNFKSLEKVWRNEKEGTLLARVKVPSEEETQYIIHPVVLDAMIQAIMMLRISSNMKKKLYVPIKIGKFIWLSNPSPDSTVLYTQAVSSSGSVMLVDSFGKILALMSSVEFIDTTVKAIDSILEQQTTSMPDIWEEVWKSQMGPLQYRVDSLKTRVSCRDLDIAPDDYNTPPPHLAETFSQVEKLVYLYILRCLYECSFEPVPGQTFSEEKLHEQLEIQNSNRKYFGFMLEVLEMEGILTKETVSNLGCEITWKVVRMPPSSQEVEESLASSTLTSELTLRYSTTPLFIKVGENLSNIMRGKQQALNILFPEENQGYPSVAEFYTTYDQLFQMRKHVIPKGLKRFAHMKEIMQGKRFILRVLEVGAGTGSYTDVILGVLAKCGIEFEYTYTDISAAFFATAEKRFESHANKMTFKKLNIEEDPIDQGFTPEYYDLVCASDVIHTTKNIKDALRNIRMIMKPHAQLDIQELTGVHRFVTFLFGLLEGFWRFEDLELRPRHCTLSNKEWKNVMESSGFEVTDVLPMMNNYHSFIWAVRTPSQLEIPSRPTSGKPKYWLIFEHENESVSSYVKKRLEAITTRRGIMVRDGKSFERGESPLKSFQIREKEEQDFVKVFTTLKSAQIHLEGIVYCWALDAGGNTSQEDILRPYFHLTKALLTADFPSSSSPRLIAVTSSTIPVGDADLFNFPCSTLWGFTKSLKNENIDMAVKFLDVEDTCLNERQMEEIFCELWNFDDKECILAYREKARLIPKIQPHKPTKNSLRLPPGSDRFQLVLPESKSISDLQFGTLDTTVLKEDEVEVQIKASALNFRDVLSVIKPSEEFKNINTVGFDFAGVVKRVGSMVRKWKAGDRVCGCNIYFTALPSHVTLNQDLLLPVGTNMPLCEAATLPAVYITSVLCLMDVAKIKRGDIVLLHTASGGVGLSAIQICKHVGCTIIATAGSKRKQNYLRGLGIQHIFHSRNTQFGDQILQLTNGRGVDVVLNSLTSEGFKEATLKACANGARFVEMSKLNIWTEEEVKALRPDVKYTVIDVSTSDENEWKRLLGNLKSLEQVGVVKPIPYCRFDALDVREALSYMQKAKHIGKIVCTMPELKTVGGEIKVLTPMFNENSTYLITGGLGGIGFVVCNWMIEKGAKHVILAGRSLPSSPIRERIEVMNSKGANVKAVQLDVGNFMQCKELIQNQIEKMRLPPLKGVMHAAGTLSDGLIINQDWSKLSSTFSTKINGSLNLHELTKDLNLEHFVVFSSMAALFGPPGQCNHAAGNIFEDNLIHFRNSVGLPGTTVNWGQWGEVGIATEVDLPGLKTVSNKQGLTGLEYVLNSQRVQLAVANVESFQMMSKLFPYLAVCLDERVWKSSNNATTSVAIKSEEFWQHYESKSIPEDKMNLLQEQLRNILRSVLKLDGNETIHEHGNFQEMGVDSLMFVEIKNHLQSLMGERVTINASALKDCNTIHSLGQILMKLIDGNGDMENVAPPTMEQVSELIKEDCILPEHIAAKPGQKVGSVRDVKTVLLVGCTGTLGPYVLKELTDSPQISRVICLMRPTKKETGDERLRKVLACKGLLSQVDMKKISCTSGNVARSQLGLNSDVYEELGGSVDAIVNCSARVQHSEHYRKRGSNDDVRAVNIGGLKNLLEFACEKKLKHVFQASSLVAVLSTDEQGQISEDWPQVGEYDGLTTFAYPISKYVSDSLIKIGVERGIPCKVFRFPFIGGEEATGRCDPEYNHVLLRYLFIMKNRIMPSNPFPMVILPVDLCANVSVRLFFNEGAPPDVYNIGIMKPDMDQEFIGVAAKFGHSVDVVEFSEFVKQVRKETQSAFSLFTDFYSDEDAVLSYFVSAPVLQRWVEGNEHVFMSKKVPALIPNFYKSQRQPMDYIYRDLFYAKSEGWFEKFEL